MIDNNDALYSVLLKVAEQREEGGAGEALAKKLENLSLQEGEGEGQVGSSSQTDERAKLDLTAFDSEALLSNLQAFSSNLSNPGDASATTAAKKAADKFTSYSEFASFKNAVTGLLGSYPGFEIAMEALKVVVSNKFKILVLIDLGGTLFFRTDEKDCGRACNYKFKRYQYFWRPGYAEMLLRL